MAMASRNEPMMSFPGNEVRLLLIGKTGNGKSTAGNTILGQKLCHPASGMCSGTEKCDYQRAYRHGISIQVTDTPGVSDTHRTKEEVHQEIAKCLATCSPGPHAILMVMRCDRRFTEEEYQAYEELKVLFGEPLKDFLVLVFNGVDSLQEGGCTLEDDLKRKPPKLNAVMQEARHVYIGLNNKLGWDERRRQGDQVLALVSQVLARNDNRCFTNDLMWEVEERIQDELDEKKDKTRDDIRHEIVQERNPTLLGRILNALTFGLVPKCAACALM